MKNHEAKLSQLYDTVENHFKANVLEPIIDVFSFKETDSVITESSLIPIRFAGYSNGYIKLPKVDNFFFPQEINAKLYNAVLPVENIPNLLPHVELKLCTKNFFYTKFKLAKITTNYTTANIFMAATNNLRELINNEKAATSPNYLCFLYYPQVVEENMFKFKDKGKTSDPEDCIKSLAYHLWLYFPVSKEAEQKYLNSVQHKIKYPELQANLTIRIDTTYDLTYEEVLV